MPKTFNEQGRRLLEAWKALGLSEAEAEFAIEDIPNVVEEWGTEMGRRLGLSEAESSVFSTLFHQGRR
jgi:hypothetical protein